MFFWEKKKMLVKTGFQKGIHKNLLPRQKDVASKRDVIKRTDPGETWIQAWPVGDLKMTCLWK